MFLGDPVQATTVSICGEPNCPPSPTKEGILHMLERVQPENTENEKRSLPSARLYLQGGKSQPPPGVQMPRGQGCLGSAPSPQVPLLPPTLCPSPTPLPETSSNAHCPSLLINRQVEEANKEFSEPPQRAMLTSVWVASSVWLCRQQSGQEDFILPSSGM